MRAISWRFGALLLAALALATPGAFAGDARGDVESFTAGFLRSFEARDLDVRMIGPETAIVSFHLENASRIARRTLVLRKESSGWRITHLHASNAPVAK